MLIEFNFSSWLVCSDGVKINLIPMCFENRHLIYSYDLYRICTFPIAVCTPCKAYLNVYAWILGITSVRPKPTKDTDVDIF